MEGRLFSYIREKCNLRDQSKESVDSFIAVIRKIMKQFYYTWIALWAILFVYYSGSLFVTIFNDINFANIDRELAKQIINGYNNIFNYLSSTAMFLIFIILNSVTVMINERKKGLGLIYSVILIVVFYLSRRDIRGYRLPAEAAMDRRRKIRQFPVCPSIRCTLRSYGRRLRIHRWQSAPHSHAILCCAPGYTAWLLRDPALVSETCNAL